MEDTNSDKTEAGIVSYYLWGHIQEPFTLYRDIKSIERGSYTVIDHDGKEETVKFADIKNSFAKGDMY